MPSLKRRINGNLHEVVSQKGEGNQLGDRENALDRGGTDDNQFYNHQAMAVPQHESLSIKYAMTTSESELQRTSNHVSDVVGVILSTTVRHQNVSSNMSSTKNTRLRILITDDSIPNGQCARVNIPSSCTTISELNLQAGDIVRFNGMEARKGDIELETLISSPLTKKQRNDTCKRTNDDEADVIHQNLLFNVVCELYPSWKEPISEPRIAILCRIGSQMPSYNPQLSFNWTNVAKRMNTPDDLIENLSKWFCSQKQHSRLVSSNPQPCQRRKLRDITSSNITSHVVVKVLRCEKTSQQWNVSKNLVAEPYITHATLSDGVECDDIMGLGGSLQVKQSGRDFCFIPKPISEILLQSLTGGCRILLTNVLSQSTSRDSLTITGRETQMLLPTRDTIATVITPDHPFYVKDSPQKENQFASQPMTLEKSSRLYSLSQQHSPAQASADSLEKGCRGVMAIISPVRDIIVDGIYASFLEGRYWQTNQSLSKFLIDTPTISTPFKSIKLRPSYRSATVLLDPTVFSDEMIINADGNALKLLCMDVPAEDMVVDGHDDEEHPYLPHVGALLKGLCEEKTLIRWILEQESESSWFVSSAALIEI